MLYTIVAEIIFDLVPSYFALIGDSILEKSIYGYYVGDLITTALSIEAALCGIVYWRIFRAKAAHNVQKIAFPTQTT